MTRARDLADSADKDIAGTLTLDDITLSNDITLADNGKAIFGAGSDLQIYHDGSHSYIRDNGTGNLLIQGSAAIVLEDPDGNNMIYAEDGGPVYLYSNGSQKLATTSTGIDVTGTAVTDGLTVAGNVSVDGGTIKLDGNYPVGTNNVALGNTALDDGSLSGNNNTAIGKATLTGNTSGGENTAVGTNALQTNSTGSSNVGLGTNALALNTTASNNTAVGYQSLYSNVTGTSLVAVGWKSLEANTTTGNTAVGMNSARATTTGADNSAIGHDALRYNTTGGFNAALGKQALFNNTTASSSTAVGYKALYSNTTTTGNTAIGYQALLNNTGSSRQVAVGYRAMENATTAQESTAVGYDALQQLTTGQNNTAIGYNALDALTTNSNNTAVGASSGTLVTGQGNTFIGSSSGNAMTSGNKNTILGRYSGNQGGLDIRTSSNNIVLSDGEGNPRMYIDSDGEVAIGATSTNYRLYVKARSGSSNGAMLISPAVVDANSAAEPVTVKIQSQKNPALDLNRFYSHGTVVQFRHNNDAVGSISVTGTSTSYNTSSDHRLKENVVELTGATDRLKQLEPKRFNFIADADTTVDGFLAHEVQSVVPEAITGTHNEVDDDGNPVYQGIDQSKLVPLLVATIQELEARITALENA